MGEEIKTEKIWQLTPLITDSTREALLLSIYAMKYYFNISLDKKNSSYKQTFFKKLKYEPLKDFFTKKLNDKIIILERSLW